MLRKLFGLGENAGRTAALRLYDQIVAAARQPVLYAQWNVPDTPLGRFEMVALHMVLFLRRVRDEKGEMAGIAQILTDEFFLDVDHSLRELGISDVGVPKRIKKLARMFYGRAKSYTEALDADDLPALEAALARNVRPGVEQWPETRDLAAYMKDKSVLLASQSVGEFASGRLSFEEPAGT
ncbi:ubiquinol-cytochrome C chaperone family protein [Tianweitania sediminis]|uniref:Ubiquinol-cytochrome C chaperone n=1 Tax=Tianweitania sediminis TaxID=1502156 RepID=A0A8J7UIM9_9HYPH|nr:ubiquinol-cytochrome C chaperone family protein [Tianweitania sediminis]MBP0439083.1 ubiquinol-cytochrome C chaperone [Tianweitania sediminis]